jgi:hypothetical protein
MTKKPPTPVEPKYAKPRTAGGDRTLAIAPERRRAPIVFPAKEMNVIRAGSTMAQAVTIAWMRARLQAAN